MSIKFNFVERGRAGHPHEPKKYYPSLHLANGEIVELGDFGKFYRLHHQ